MLDIRFSRALQMMLFLAVAAENGSAPLSSAELAHRLHANPSLVRKLLVPLTDEGLTVCVKGRTGGARLGRPADRITLAEIYRCAVGDKPLWAPSPGVEPVCAVTAHAGEYFAALTVEAEEAVLGSLGDRTLADGVRELRRLDTGCARH
ncbi:Rrf2 family transcriptional regulator [Streptomyces samsunensis]|uniref:Rrf2 family transcriptional regulator n=2 Tax=Streptomyces TaxID=1883 RepID=A0ABX6VZB8_STRMQ|nr:MULTISPECIES: Rrf2 family transcriptional regulator [Streptomyces]MYU11360.1 Rrf2 family transcriptional regulator [Streptomyces sp. SID8361]MYX60305.1 Rrf2 family transcriptional regulator [Streptomyces sp. SID8382]AQA10207.1 transcriptional regulator [Streptomyces autolyticus]ATL80794.1 BadM/Rrf2 family transcriptional regulator [Streptomyces malaysiensis]AUA15825.1 iron-responsive transcriptional regulator [Streptomyces sp. M56]